MAKVGGSSSSGVLSRLARSLVQTGIMTSASALDPNVRFGASGAQKHTQQTEDAVQQASSRMKDAGNSFMKSMNRDYDTFTQNLKDTLNANLGNIYDFHKKQWGFQKTLWFNLLKNMATGIKTAVTKISGFMSDTVKKVGGIWTWLLDLGKKIAAFFSVNIYEFAKKKIGELKNLMNSIPGAPRALANFKLIRDAVYETGRSIGQAPAKIQAMTTAIVAMGNSLIPAQKYLEAYTVAIGAGARGALTDAALRNLTRVSQATNASMESLTTYYFNLQRLGKSDDEIMQSLQAMYGSIQLANEHLQYGITMQQSVDAVIRSQSQINTLRSVGRNAEADALERAASTTAFLEAATGITNLNQIMTDAISNSGSVIYQAMGGQGAQLAAQGGLVFWNEAFRTLGGIYGAIEKIQDPTQLYLVENAFRDIGMPLDVGQMRLFTRGLADLARLEGFAGEAALGAAAGTDYMQTSIEGARTPAEMLDYALQDLGSHIMVGDQSLEDFLEQFERFETVFDTVSGGLDFLNGSLDFMFGPLSNLVKPFTAISTIFMALGALSKDTGGQYIVSDAMLENIGPLGAALKLLRGEGTAFQTMFQNLKTFFVGFFNNLFVVETEEQTLFERLIEGGLRWLEENQGVIVSSINSFAGSITGAMTTMFESLRENSTLYNMLKTLFDSAMSILSPVVSGAGTTIAGFVTTLIHTLVDIVETDNGVKDAVGDLLSTIWEAFKPMVSTIWTSLMDGFADILDLTGIDGIEGVSDMFRRMGSSTNSEFLAREGERRELEAARNQPGSSGVGRWVVDTATYHILPDQTVAALDPGSVAVDAYNVLGSAAVDAYNVLKGLVPNREGSTVVNRPTYMTLGGSGPESVIPLGRWGEHAEAIALRTSAEFLDRLKAEQDRREAIAMREEAEVEKVQSQFISLLSNFGSSEAEIAQVFKGGSGWARAFGSGVMTTFPPALQAIYERVSALLGLSSGGVPAAVETAISTWSAKESALLGLNAAFSSIWVAREGITARAATPPASSPSGGTGPGNAIQPGFEAGLENANENILGVPFAKVYEGAVNTLGDTRNLCATFASERLRMLGYSVPSDTTTTREINDWLIGHLSPSRIESPNLLSPGDFIFSHTPTLPGSPAGHVSLFAYGTDNDFYAWDQHGLSDYSWDKFLYALRPTGTESFIQSQLMNPESVEPTYMAKGGTVMKETLLIAGEAGPEEIIPYSKIDENTRLTIQAHQESTEELIETITPSLIEFVGLLRQINSNIKEGKSSSIEALFDNVRALR